MAPGKFDGLIFDLDGTLWDTAAACAIAYNKAYESLGVPKRISKEFVQAMAGRPADECDALLLKDVPAELHHKVQNNLSVDEIESLIECAPNAPYPGVFEGLESLSKRFKLYVVSNCGLEYLEVFLKHSGIGHFFTDTECFGRTRNPKFKSIKLLLERQKLVSTCYIGDTAWDEEAAEAAGIPFFHVLYGYGKPIKNPIAFSNFKELETYFLTH
jgi:phosphoglycolate phosphatase